MTGIYWAGNLLYADELFWMLESIMEEDGEL